MMHTPRTTFLYAVRQGVGSCARSGLGMGISSMQQILTDPGVSGRAAAALLVGRDRDAATTAAQLKDAPSSIKITACARRRCIRWRCATIRRCGRDLEPMLEDDKEEVRLPRRGGAAQAIGRASFKASGRPGRRRRRRNERARITG